MKQYSKKLVENFFFNMFILERLTFDNLELRNGLSLPKGIAAYVTAHLHLWTGASVQQSFGLLQQAVRDSVPQRCPPIVILPVPPGHVAVLARKERVHAWQADAAVGRPGHDEPMHEAATAAVLKVGVESRAPPVVDEPVGVPRVEEPLQVLDVEAV